MSPGLMSRVVEVNVRDENISEATIKTLNGAFQNYGHAGMLFVQAMQDEGLDREKVIAEIDARVDKLAGTGPKQERRASRALACVWFAGGIAQRAGLIPSEYDVEAAVRDLWDAVRGKADTKRTVIARVISALSNAVRGARIDIHSDDGNLMKSYESKECDGAIYVSDFKATGTAAFVLPSATLKRIAGEDAGEVAKMLDAEGMLELERDGRLQWQKGRTGVGEVSSYVIIARAVLGDAVEDIEERRQEAVKARSGTTEP